MDRLRKQLILKMRAARHLLETSQGYLKVVGSQYLERYPETTEKYKLVYNALEEIKGAIDKLIEEI